MSCAMQPGSMVILPAWPRASALPAEVAALRRSSVGAAALAVSVLPVGAAALAAREKKRTPVAPVAARFQTYTLVTRCRCRSRDHVHEPPHRMTDDEDDDKGDAKTSDACGRTTEDEEEDNFRLAAPKGVEAIFDARRATEEDTDIFMLQVQQLLLYGSSNYSRVQLQKFVRW